MLQYDLNNETQINSFTTSSNAEFLYDSYDEAYVFDSSGLIKMSNSEMLNEYHTKNTYRDLKKKTVPGYSWGRRLVPSICGVFFLLDNKIVLPYSLLCKVQYKMERSLLSENSAATIFYPKDFYKINGKTPLHKF